MSTEIESGLIQDIRELDAISYSASPADADGSDATKRGGDGDGTDGSDGDGMDGEDSDGTDGGDSDGTDGEDSDGTDGDSDGTDNA